jgi:hypothetical protein
MCRVEVEQVSGGRKKDIVDTESEKECATGEDLLVTRQHSNQQS